MFELSKLKVIYAKVVAVITAIVIFIGQIGYSTPVDRDIYSKSENAIRVMTFNVLCYGSDENLMINRFGIAAQTIAEYYPDSIGLQEATPEWMLWLNNQLPEYDYVGVGRETGRYLGEFAAIFYLKDKYKVIDSGNFWISETPQVPSKGWDACCKRICTWAVFENMQTGERYAHINTHLDQKGVVARENGVNMILEKAASFDIPVVCTGDFNLRQNSELYTTLTAGVLQDTKFVAPDTMDHATFHDFSATVDPTKIIDFIFTNSSMTPLVYKVVTEGIDGEPVSDHYPVYSDMVLSAE
jgi:endonuclease/exonuclease/phosphatase family metal-dependent hydrolase